MRPGLRNLFTIVALALCVGSATLWVWSLGDTRFLLSDFFHGRFDGDRGWRGYYLAVSRGQLAFELERIRYSTRPTRPPVNRWSAEDEVGLRTPALRSLPIDSPLGFHYGRESGVGPAGRMDVTRLAFPLWAVLLASLLVVLHQLRTRLRRRSPANARRAVPA